MSDYEIDSLRQLATHAETMDKALNWSANEIERLRQGCTFDKDGLPLTVCSRLADTRARLEEGERLLRSIARNVLAMKFRDALSPKDIEDHLNPVFDEIDAFLAGDKP